MLISFLDRSNPKFSSSLLGAQKIALNQFLENPINPKTFIIKIDKIPKVQEMLKTKLNKKNSQTNFNVPGIPEKKKIIKSIEIAKLLKVKNIPLTLKIDLDLYLQ